MRNETPDFSGIQPGQDRHPHLRGARYNPGQVGTSLLSRQRDLRPASINPGEQANKNRAMNRALAARSGILATLKDVTMPDEMEALLAGV